MRELLLGFVAGAATVAIVFSIVFARLEHKMCKLVDATSRRQQALADLRARIGEWL